MGLCVGNVGVLLLETVYMNNVNYTIIIVWPCISLFFNKVFLPKRPIPIQTVRYWNLFTNNSHWLYTFSKIIKFDYRIIWFYLIFFQHLAVYPALLVGVAKHHIGRIKFNYFFIKFYNYSHILLETKRSEYCKLFYCHVWPCIFIF